MTYLKRLRWLSNEPLGTHLDCLLRECPQSIQASHHLSFDGVKISTRAWMSQFVPELRIDRLHNPVCLEGVLCLRNIRFCASDESIDLTLVVEAVPPG